jgi:signal peptidase I
VEEFRAEMIPEPLPSPEEDGSWQKFLLDTLQTLVISVILFVLVNSLTVRIRVESVSMQDTLFPGNFVIVNRLAYKFNQPGRGDVVVFDPPIDSEEPYVKRVIGLAGEVVEIRDGEVLIDDLLLQENYVQSAIRTEGTWEVPLGSIFVMGDNRNNSSDSRVWGSVPLENLIGQAVFVYWPLEQWGALAPSAVAAEAGGH